MATQVSKASADTLSLPLGERELALSFQRGERDAYESIYRRYTPRVESLCLRMLGDSQEAQDAVQETFLRVYQALPRFNGRYQLGAWINRIGTNVCLDTLRARSRVRYEVAPNDVLEEVVEAEAHDVPEQSVLRRDVAARLKKTLAGLPPLQRKAIVLRDFEGRTYSEIATALEITECRARVLLHRARKAFMKSWSSGWILVGLRLRFLQRVRRLGAPAADQIAGVARESVCARVVDAAQPAAACGQALQGCGAVVTERVAAVAAAALVGMAAVGGGAGVSGRAQWRSPAEALHAAGSGAGVLASAVEGLERHAGDLVAAVGVPGERDVEGSGADASSSDARAGTLATPTDPADGRTGSMAMSTSIGAAATDDTSTDEPTDSTTTGVADPTGDPTTPDDPTTGVTEPTTTPGDPTAADPTGDPTTGAIDPATIPADPTVAGAIDPATTGATPPTSPSTTTPPTTGATIPATTGATEPATTGTAMPDGITAGPGTAAPVVTGAWGSACAAGPSYIHAFADPETMVGAGLPRCSGNVYGAGSQVDASTGLYRSGAGA